MQCCQRPTAEGMAFVARTWCPVVVSFLCPVVGILLFVSCCLCSGVRVLLCVPNCVFTVLRVPLRVSCCMCSVACLRRISKPGT